LSDTLNINCLSIFLFGRNKRLVGGSYRDFMSLVKPIGTYQSGTYGMATILGAGRSGVRIPAEARFSVPHNVQTGSGDHRPSFSFSMCTGAPSRG